MRVRDGVNVGRLVIARNDNDAGARNGASMVSHEASQKNYLGNVRSH